MPPWSPYYPLDTLLHSVPPPIANRRTGKVRLPTIWTALAGRVLDPDEDEGTRKLCAETLCRLMLAAQANGGHDGD